MSLLTPIQLGLSAYMIGYHQSLIADTQFVQEFAARPVAKSIVWAAGRMIDSVEDMLKSWRQNENNPGPGMSSMLPVIFLALDRNYMPVLPEYSVAVPETPFVFPDDELGRVYHCSTVTNEYKVQVVFVAPEMQTAHSLLVQWHTWLTQGPAGRRFYSEYEFAGFKTKWPCVLEAIDPPGVVNAIEQPNITILVSDMTVRATVPRFRAPGAGQQNDGKAAPAGYPVVIDIESLGTLEGALGTHTGSRISTRLDDAGEIIQEWS
jgi:hypothetical protein